MFVLIENGDNPLKYHSDDIVIVSDGVKVDGVIYEFTVQKSPESECQFDIVISNHLLMMKLLESFPVENNFTRIPKENVSGHGVPYSIKISDGMKFEKLFLELIKGVYIRTDIVLYPDSIFHFNEDGKIIIEYGKKNNECWFDTFIFWKRFRELGLDYKTMMKNLKLMVSKYLKYPDAEPISGYFCGKKSIEDHFKNL